MAKTKDSTEALVSWTPPEQQAAPIAVHYSVWKIYTLRTEEFPAVLLHAGYENVKHLFYIIMRFLMIDQ